MTPPHRSTAPPVPDPSPYEPTDSWSRAQSLGFIHYWNIRTRTLSRPDPDIIYKRGPHKSQRYLQVQTGGIRTEDAAEYSDDLEGSIEEMLIRLDEFCAMMDMIRSETSLILEDRIPAIKFRVEEMNKIYCRVEKIEAFVKMVGYHVSYMEEEVIRAERDNLSFPQAVNRFLAGAPLPSFLRKNSKPHSAYQLPALYRTEDYFPASCK
ncbi:breast carcinoma-amplified sequence 4 isoform X1 [Rhinoderma darwinii]|uniref:breast carcinoma-amplified sequence 4 isoform X1 n=1 Tax=Rhinoderma darwinii TaxID=43563 RepID=UPI003F67E7E8